MIFIADVQSRRIGDLFSINLLDGHPIGLAKCSKPFSRNPMIEDKMKSRKFLFAATGAFAIQTSISPP
jgi:hypothetical protein